MSDALYIACRNGHVEVARFLLDHGGDPNFKAYMRGTPLHWAAYSGVRELIDLLLERGADPNQRADDDAKSTYLQFAIRIPISWGMTERIAPILGKLPELVNWRSDNWGPPLHEATKKGQLDAVEVLIRAGAEVNATVLRQNEIHGCTALDLALESSQDAIAAILRAHGAKTGHEL